MIDIETHAGGSVRMNILCRWEVLPWCPRDVIPSHDIPHHFFQLIEWNLISCSCILLGLDLEKAPRYRQLSSGAISASTTSTTTTGPVRYLYVCMTNTKSRTPYPMTINGGPNYIKLPPTLQTLSKTSCLIRLLMWAIPPNQS